MIGSGCVSLERILGGLELRILCPDEAKRIRCGFLTILSMERLAFVGLVASLAQLTQHSLRILHKPRGLHSRHWFWVIYCGMRLTSIRALIAFARSHLGKMSGGSHQWLLPRRCTTWMFVENMASCPNMPSIQTRCKSQMHPALLSVCVVLLIIEISVNSRIAMTRTLSTVGFQ